MLHVKSMGTKTPRLGQTGNLGHNLKRLRTVADLSQQELADKSGVDRSTIIGIERGTRQPHVSNLAKLAKALRVNMIEFFAADAAR